MNKDELLLPRYKVIASWPGSQLRVGDILIYVGNNCFKCNDLIFHGSILTEHVHLFKKLEWWEARAPEDMPEYIKLNPENTIGGDIVFKVEGVKTFTDGIGLTIEPSLYPESLEQPAYTACKYFIPSTLEEYEAYQKTTKEQ